MRHPLLSLALLATAILSPCVSALDQPIDRMTAVNGKDSITVVPPFLFKSSSAPATVSGTDVALFNDGGTMKFKTASGTLTIGSGGASTGTSTSILAGNGSGGFADVTFGTGLSFDSGTHVLSPSGALATYAGIAPSANVQTILGATDYAAVRTSLGLVIGTNVQAYNSSLAAIAGGTWTGASSITTLGTIATGTWQGSVIAPAYLGGGSSITTKYLRGDGTWQTVGGSGDMLKSDYDPLGFGYITGKNGFDVGGTPGNGGALVMYGGDGVGVTGSLSSATGAGGAGSSIRGYGGVGAAHLDGLEENGFAADAGAASALWLIGGNAYADATHARPGGNAGTIDVRGADATTSADGGNGGSLLMSGSAGVTAGDIDTRAGGSLTMGTGSLSGGSVTGTILTTAGSGANLTSLNASNISSGTLATERGGRGTLGTDYIDPSLANGISSGRLTLSTGVPVLTSSVTSAGTVYFTPFKGNSIALYTGSAWKVMTFSELSITLSSLSASTAYDVFAYDNSGTVALDTTAWTNATTRATALTRQDGVMVKSGATTRRYLGSFITDGSKQCSVTFGANGTAGQGQCDIWNNNHRVRIEMACGDTTDNWSYTTTSFRAYNGSNGASGANNRITLFIGVAEDAISACFLGASGGAATARYVGIGIDSTTVNSANGGFFPSLTNVFVMPANLTSTGLVGQHYFQALEKGAASIVFYGDNGATFQTGLSVVWMY